MQTRPLTQSDYEYIVSVLDRWWGGPSGTLAHPMFFYELGRLARVAVADDTVVGFLLGFICPDRPTGYVHLVGIHPEYRRQGVGGLLYAAFEEGCRAEGCTELKAITTANNEGSVRFHLAQGWSMKEEPNYAGVGRLRIVFNKALSQGRAHGES